MLENAREDDNILRQLSKMKEEKRRDKQRLKTYKVSYTHVEMSLVVLHLAATRNYEK